MKVFADVRGHFARAHDKRKSKKSALKSSLIGGSIGKELEDEDTNQNQSIPIPNPTILPLSNDPLHAIYCTRNRSESRESNGK
jgi:hypothetical protein